MKLSQPQPQATALPPDRHDIPDVQASADIREIDIQRVGIKDLRHPLEFVDRSGTPVNTVAHASMTVHLPKEYKGTHMSRFVELLNETRKPLSIRGLQALVEKMNQRLQAQAGHIELTFPYFLRKQAPVSGVASLMDYSVTLAASVADQRFELTVKVVIPITSLCPCSKEISDYGAHNQRSHVTVDARVDASMWIEDLIDLVEDQASSELYALLKRHDEKFVTEQAYDNPKFVEDVIRDVAAQLNMEPRIHAYTLEVENFEAIHNHSAYAMIEVNGAGD
jgi:GTP cyclohydrolase I